MTFGKSSHTTSRVGLLLSGGLDSAILLSHFMKTARRVQPFYVQSGLFWEAPELRAVRDYLSAVATQQLSAVATQQLDPLVVLNLPLEDIYENHWSVTGRDVPALDSADEAVFLPGRNPLLAIKAAFWCQLHGIRELALATLSSDPFPDATPAFFQELESVLQQALSAQLKLIRPFDGFDKRQVMELGREAPLELTFSCIAPIGDRHCGRCNKCGERQRAFRVAGRQDLTEYAVAVASK